jgi:choline dehydrogenase-like flavoprotein
MHWTARREPERGGWDAIVIGSGFGGTMAARELVAAGWRVLMLERGDWVRRGAHNWAPGAVAVLGDCYSMETPYRALAGGEREWIGALECVGGPSVFYGGVSLRFREADFAPAAEIVGDSGARWPVDYDELEPYYTRAEQALGVAGDDGEDPVAPWRSEPYPHPPAALSPTSRRIWESARRLGYRPFRLPLALNHHRAGGRTPCVACGTCDLFACAVSAKNDLATVILPELLASGLVLRPRTVAVRLRAVGSRVVGVDCVDRDTGAAATYEARHFVLAAGALASPHLVLASGLEARSTAPDAVGRYLSRHHNVIVAGLFPRATDPDRQFHKQVGIHDCYFGDPDGDAPAGKLGGIQQLPTPPPELVRAHLPPVVGRVMAPLLRNVTGLLTMTEDQPRAENGVAVDASRRDRFGLPVLVVRHRPSRRDAAASGVLVRHARRVLREAGAVLTRQQLIRTFSHAVGTLRAGDDPRTAPVDRDGRFRGLDNLVVADASVFPTAGGVNPSLTIAALALRAGERLAAREQPAVVARRRPLRVVAAAAGEMPCAG